METFSRSQILQDFNFQCSKLASNNNRGFKQAFRVTTTKINDTSELWFIKCGLSVSMVLTLSRSWMMLGKISPVEPAAWRPTEKKTDTIAFCHVSGQHLTLLPIMISVSVNIWHVFFFLFHLIADDHCRVRLSVQNQNPNSDYINANFVPVRALSLSFSFFVLVCVTFPTSSSSLGSHHHFMHLFVCT